MWDLMKFILFFIDLLYITMCSLCIQAEASSIVSYRSHTSSCSSPKTSPLFHDRGGPFPLLPFIWIWVTQKRQCSRSDKAPSPAGKAGSLSVFLAKTLLFLYEVQYSRDYQCRERKLPISIMSRLIILFWNNGNVEMK